jgi:hypothetical protein
MYATARFQDICQDCLFDNQAPSFHPLYTKQASQSPRQQAQRGVKEGEKDDIHDHSVGDLSGQVREDMTNLKTYLKGCNSLEYGTAIRNLPSDDQIMNNVISFLYTPVCMTLGR